MVEATCTFWSRPAKNSKIVKVAWQRKSLRIILAACLIEIGPCGSSSTLITFHLRSRALKPWGGKSSIPTRSRHFGELAPSTLVASLVCGILFQPFQRSLFLELCKDPSLDATHVKFGAFDVDLHCSAIGGYLTYTPSQMLSLLPTCRPSIRKRPVRTCSANCTRQREHVLQQQHRNRHVRVKKGPQIVIARASQAT